MSWAAVCLWPISTRSVLCSVKPTGNNFIRVSLFLSLSFSVCVCVFERARARHFVARTYLCLLRTCANHHIIANDLFLFLFFFPFRRCCFFGCCPLFFATAVDISDGFATSLTPRKRTKHEKVATGDRMEAGVALPRRWEAPPPASVPLPVPLNFYRHCHRPPIHRKKRNNIQSSIQGRGENLKRIFSNFKFNFYHYYLTSFVCYVKQ